jgi:hypothetical protein
VGFKGSGTTLHASVHDLLLKISLFVGPRCFSACGDTMKKRGPVSSLRKLGRDIGRILKLKIHNLS